MVVVSVIVYIACCYHIRRIRILVAVSASFLPRARMKLLLRVNVAVCGSATASRDRDRVFSIGPLICQAHEVVDGLGLASSQLFSEVSPDETVPKSVNGPFQ
jgi:hypothetical protein